MSISDKTVRESMCYKFIYSLAGLFLGFISMIGGIALFLGGIIGKTGWTAKILGVESTITDAAPGSLLFMMGVLVVFITRFRVVIERSVQTKAPRGNGERIQLTQRMPREKVSFARRSVAPRDSEDEKT